MLPCNTVNTETPHDKLFSTKTTQNNIAFHSFPLNFPFQRVPFILEQKIVHSRILYVSHQDRFDRVEANSVYWRRSFYVTPHVQSRRSFLKYFCGVNSHIMTRSSL